MRHQSGVAHDRFATGARVITPTGWPDTPVAAHRRRLYPAHPFTLQASSVIVKAPSARSGPTRPPASPRPKGQPSDPPRGQTVIMPARSERREIHRTFASAYFTSRAGETCGRIVLAPVSLWRPAALWKGALTAHDRQQAAHGETPAMKALTRLQSDL